MPRSEQNGALIASARKRHELARSKAVQALRELDRARIPASFEAVARQAGVSRSWLYSQPDIRAEIERLRALTHRADGPAISARQRASERSLQARLDAAAERIRVLTEENQRLRRRLEHALGDARAATTRTSAGRP